MNPIKVAIVNDYDLVVHGLSAMLAPFDDRVQVVAVEIGGLPEVPADIALFDTFAGRRSALARVDAMAEDASLGKVVLYTWDLPDEFASDIGRRAIDAVILKSTSGELLVEALERVHRNEPVEPCEPDLFPGVPTLSEREREVLASSGAGCPTDRSPTSCTCRSTPSRPTSARCSASSGSGTARRPRWSPSTRV